MSRPRKSREPTGNRLLDLLPDEDHDRLRPELETVHIGVKEAVCEANEPIPHVYFPTGAVISLAAPLADGATAELATVGREGMVGLPVFLGADTMPSRAFGQVPGEALRMGAGAFRAEVERHGPLVRVLNRYTHALFHQAALVLACNGVHSAERRCARSLLQTHDRVGADQFLLTQEFLAMMLGVRRARVSAAAGQLRKAGLIRYARGQMTILDRPGLVSASCECYRVIEREFDRLLG
jgi:CRP-like cAMP-binding protein